MSLEELVIEVERVSGLPPGTTRDTRNRTPYIVLARSAVFYIAQKRFHLGFRKLGIVFASDHSLASSGFNRIAIGLSNKDPGITAFMRKFYEAGLLQDDNA